MQWLQRCPYSERVTTSFLPTHDRQRNYALTPPSALQDSPCSVASAAASLCRIAAHSILTYPSPCTGNMGGVYERCQTSWQTLDWRAFVLYQPITAAVTPPQSPCKLHADSHSGLDPVDPKIRFETTGQSELGLRSATAQTTCACTPFFGVHLSHRRVHHPLGSYKSPNSPMASAILATYSEAAS
jgi:hypothetical protein